MKPIKKILISKNKKEKFYWKEKDMHTLLGKISEKDIENSKGIVKSHLDKEFYVLDPLFTDKIEKIQRAPAIMLPKDIGLILALTGINKDSTVLDAGTGSGVLAAFLSQFVKKVITYEIKEEFVKIAKENFEFLNIKNIEIKNKNIFEGIDEKELDLIVLDLLDSEKALPYAEKSLKQSHYLVAYLPNITQVINFCKEIEKYNFILDKVTELIQRDWTIELPKIHPENRGLTHTAFLVFIRKV